MTLVRPGGRIVFSNCSLDPLEGEELVAAFLAENSGVDVDPVRAGEIAGIDGFRHADGDAAHHARRPGPRHDPALSGLDGFFAARLRRIA